MLEHSFQESCKSLHIPMEATDSRPHVLFIIDELCEMGGAERVLLKMVRLMPQQAFRCSLLTFKIRPEIEELRNIGCPLYVWPLRKTYDWNALKVAGQILRLIRQERVSIVHTFFETSDIWGAMVARISGCPVLISSRRDLGILRSRKHRIAYRMIGHFYDAVLAVSPQVREFCIQTDGLKPARVHTLFNGLEMDPVIGAEGRAVMRRRDAIPENVPVIATVANIRRVKGLDVLVRAARLVCDQHPDTIFLIIGRKSEQEYCRELEEMVHSLGLDSNFRMVGSREDVLSLLKMSDVFCLPSRSEGFSNALIEAMACGLPCVATDVGGNREALEDQVSGFIVASEDWQKMGDRLTALLDDRQMAAGMGRHGEAVVRQKFTAEAMMENLVGIYGRLLLARGHS